MLAQDELVSSKHVTASSLTSARGACCGLQHLRGHKVDLGVVRGLDTAFDPQHFSNSVLISMANLKFFPGLPEICSHLKDQVHAYIKGIMVWILLMEKLHAIKKKVMAGDGFSHPGVTDLGAVGVDCSGSINLAKFTLHVSKSQTHVPRMLIRKDLYKQKGTIDILVIVIMNRTKEHNDYVIYSFTGKTNACFSGIRTDQIGMASF